MHPRDIPIPLASAPGTDSDRSGATYAFRRGAQRVQSSNILFLFLIGALVGGIGLLTMLIVRPDGRRSAMTRTMSVAIEAPPPLSPVTAVPPVAAVPAPAVVAAFETPSVADRTAKAHVVKKRGKPSTRARSKNGPVQVN